MAAQQPCPPQTTEASGESWGTTMGRDIRDPAIHLAKGMLKDFNSYYQHVFLVGFLSFSMIQYILNNFILNRLKP